MAKTTFDIGGERLDAAALAARLPGWVRDVAAIRSLARAPRGLSLPPPPAPSSDPLFDPWRASMLATAVSRQRLLLGSGPVAPRPERSFAHGTAAFLPSPEWPACGGCGSPLELCLQLAPSAASPWLPRPGSLVLMYCFQCSPRYPSEGREGVFLRIVEPRALATRRAGPTSSSSHTSATQTRGVEVTPPSWQVPSAMWFRYRLDIEDLGGAAAVLLGREEVTAEVHDDSGEPDEVELFEAYDEWAEAVNGRGQLGDSALGGYPRWDQADETPDCEGCGAPMQHLVDWNGEQFLDGALHVFVCDRTPACGEGLGFVAEF